MFNFKTFILKQGQFLCLTIMNYKRHECKVPMNLRLAVSHSTIDITCIWDFIFIIRVEDSRD